MKFSQVTPNSAPALIDYLMGVTSANVDFRVTLQNLLTVLLKTQYLFNAYKFSIYRGVSPQSLTSGVVQYDTKIYDTGSNADIVTNKGRFTAPISGYYDFSCATLVNATSGDHILIAFTKNGAEFERLTEETVGASTNFTRNGSIQCFLTAGDYIELTASFGGGSRSLLNGAAFNWFSGKLASLT